MDCYIFKIVRFAEMRVVRFFTLKHVWELILISQMAQKLVYFLLIGLNRETIRTKAQWSANFLKFYKN